MRQKFPDRRVAGLRFYCSLAFPLGAALVLVLAGCVRSDQRPASSSSSSTLETGLPVEPSIIQPSEAADVPHDEDLPAASDAVAEATRLGTSALAAFCRPALDYDTWIGELYPFLSQSAGAAYETVDPANVPCTGVTGESVVRDGGDPYTVGIAVPTDAGDYEVYLHRTGDDSPWAVEQISSVSAD